MFLTKVEQKTVGAGIALTESLEERQWSTVEASRESLREDDFKEVATLTTRTDLLHLLFKFTFVVIALYGSICLPRGHWKGSTGIQVRLCPAFWGVDTVANAVSQLFLAVDHNQVGG